MKKIILVFVLCSFLFGCHSNKTPEEAETNIQVPEDLPINQPMARKPVIYLYPQSKTNVNVQIDYKGELTFVYPKLSKNGWSVTAYPDGKLIDRTDNREYSYLFWEGEKSGAVYDLSKGFSVIEWGGSELE